MKDKKSFGQFIAEKRKEKNLTQSELADKLFVTKTAVSKWERGVTYPDITLISDLCNVLEVDEHELITESNTGEYRKMKSDAKKFKKISDIYFYGLCAVYGIALLVCFICNIAVNKTLSWFFIVFTSILTAFTVFPSVSRLFNKFKAVAVVSSFILALSVLLLTCCLYTHGNWFFIAFCSILLAVTSIFLPVFLKIYNFPQFIKRNAPVICELSDFVFLTILLIACLHSSLQNLFYSFAISLYFFTPTIICTVIFCYTKISLLFKSSIACLMAGVIAYFSNPVMSKLFGNEYSFKFNLFDWRSAYLSNNINFIILILLLFSALILFITGLFKIRIK